MLKRIFVSTFLATSLLSVLSLVARAQDVAPTEPPATGAQQPVVDPNMLLNELHGDWSVRCFNVESQAPCDIIQVGTDAESQQRVSLVSLAYLPHNDSYLAQIIVPLGIAITRGLSIEAGEASLVGLRYNRCETDGCYVEIPFPQATIDALSGLQEDTLITVFSYQGEMTEMPFSITGFAEAIEHMKAEAQERAVQPPPQ